MICDSVINLTRYLGINKNLDRAIKFLQDFGGQAELGKIIIDGENVFANVMVYTSKEIEEGTFEAHQKYLDIHLLIEGEEIVYNTPLDQLTVTKAYVEASDLALYQGEALQRCILRPGEAVICFPQDGHMPGMKSQEVMEVKKMVVKVKVG